MKLGIDLDGVVYPFVATFKRYCEALWKQELPEVESWDFPTLQWGITMPEFVGLMAQSCKEGHLWWTGEPEPGSVEALTRLRDEGHRLFILTDRAPKGGEGAAEAATYTWLRNNDIPYDGLFITRNKTGLVDVLIDDGPHNVEAARQMGEYAVTMHRRWNTHVQGPRVYSMKQFADHIEGLEHLNTLLTRANAA